MAALTSQVLHAGLASTPVLSLGEKIRGSVGRSAKTVVRLDSSQGQPSEAWLTDYSSRLRGGNRIPLEKRTQHGLVIQRIRVAPSASSSVPTTTAVSSETGSYGAGGKVTGKRVVVLGGSGRVGGSSAANLAAFSAGGQESDCDYKLDIVIAGRDRARGEEACLRVGGNTSFVQCDIDDDQALRDTLDGADLVVHSAGPFQRKERCAVLEAAIATKTAYIDVCDDRDYSQRARALHEEARLAGVPALTTTGIYPGVSNLMAAELVRLARRGAAEDDGAEGSEPKSLRFSYYTAGSGGAGPTILATSFLLLGEEVVAYKDGKRLTLPPYSNCRVVDFGKGVGKKPVYLLNLPEVESAHSVLGAPTVSARFGTDPPIWNWAMELMVALLPAEVLKDRSKVQGLVELSDPLVRVVDTWAGEKMAMRVDLECTDGRKAVALYSHRMLSKCVGQATAAFALAVLEGSTQPGVWFPEEEGGIAPEARERLLERSARGTIRYMMNRSPWVIEDVPKQIGFGLYY